MKLHFLGTGAFLPDRNDSCLAVEWDGRLAVIDCGEPCAKLLRNLGPDPESVFSRIEAIFISHMHFDHVTGLPLLLFQVTKARAQLSPPGYDLYVPACANPDIMTAVEILNRAGKTNQTIAEAARLHSLRDGAVAECHGLEVTALANVGGEPLESYAFRLESGGKRVLYSGDLPGRLDPILPYLEGIDLLILETGHVDPFQAAAVLAEYRLPGVVFSHLGPHYASVEHRILKEVSPVLRGTSVWLARDGWSLDC